MLKRKLVKFIFINFPSRYPEFAFYLVGGLKKNGAALPSSGRMAKVPSKRHFNKAKICFTDFGRRQQMYIVLGKTLTWLKTY